MINTHLYKSESLWQEAAKFLTKQIVPDKKMVLLLSGGSSTKIYPALGEYLQKGSYQIALAQVDERFQPESQESVNSYDIGRTNLWKVCDERKIPYFLVSQEKTLAEASSQYNEILNRLFRDYPLKIAVLGIGPDGHTAGLLPGYEKVWNTNQYVVGYQNSGLYPKRISITPKAIKELDYGLVIAVGEAKKEPIKKALAGKNVKDLNRCPASILRQIKRADLFTDVKI